MTQSIYIVGSKVFQQKYGGLEVLFEKLTEFQQDKYQYYVSLYAEFSQIRVTAITQA